MKPQKERCEREWSHLAFEFGELVRAARKRRGLTASTLAIRIGLPLASISLTESGTHIPNLAKVYSLAEAIGCPVEELLPRETWEVTP